MGQQKRLRRGAGVITGAIMDQKQVRRGLCHDPLQKGSAFRVKPALDALIEQTPGEILNGAEDFVTLACWSALQAVGHGLPSRYNSASPHWAKLASSSNRINPFVRLAARTMAGHFSS